MYDSSGQRVLKTAVDANLQQSHTVYVFPTLELRRAQLKLDDGSSTPDYERTALTEVGYLFANDVRLARLVFEPHETAVPVLRNDHEQLYGRGSTLHVFFELGDHLGSTNVVLDQATSELVEYTTFQAYGATESDYRPDRWANFREDYRFTGKEEDVEVGLVYFGKRYLNPLLGRWASPDPLAIHGPGQADLNLYAYVKGAVLKAIDPVGLSPDLDPYKPQVDEGGGAAEEMVAPEVAKATVGDCGERCAPKEAAVGTLGHIPYPERLTTGTHIHMMIKADVERKASMAGLTSYNNLGVGTIIGEVGHVDAKGLKTPKNTARRPDVVIDTGFFLAVWEIKTEHGGAALAANEARSYVNELSAAGTPAILGPSANPLVTGAIPTDVGMVDYWSPQPGAILYRLKPQPKAPVPVVQTQPQKEPNPGGMSEKEKNDVLRNGGAGVAVVAILATIVYFAASVFGFGGA